MLELYSPDSLLQIRLQHSDKQIGLKFLVLGGTIDKEWEEEFGVVRGFKIRNGVSIYRKRSNRFEILESYEYAT